MGLADAGRMGLSILVCATFWKGISIPEKCLQIKLKAEGKKTTSRSEKAVSSPVVPTWTLSNQPFLFTKRINSSQIEGPVLPVCCRAIPFKQMKSPLGDLAIPKLQWVHEFTNSTQVESM